MTEGGGGVQHSARHHVKKVSPDRSKLSRYELDWVGEVMD